jgi:hypothetical protein
METELTFHKVLNDIDHLSLDEQETLVDIVRKRLAEKRRRQIIADVNDGEKEFEAGRLKPATVSEIMREMTS